MKRNLLEQALAKVIAADEKKMEEEIERAKNAERNARLVQIY